MSQWRVQQWRAFAKQWFIYDAYMQCPMLSGEKISRYLMGKHLRYYDKESDFGSHVIVCNSRHIAAKDNSRYWKRFLYSTHTRFGVYRVDETMEEIHKRDPTDVMRREIIANLPSGAGRKYWMSRLFIYPDGVETVPEDKIANLSGVIRQVLPIARRLDEYTQEELDEYPKLFDWPDDFCLRPLSRHSIPTPDTNPNKKKVAS